MPPNEDFGRHNKRSDVSFRGTFLGCESLWRTKKSHFQPSDEMRMQKVDKDAVITKIGLILLSRCITILKIDANVHFKSFHAFR